MSKLAARSSDQVWIKPLKRSAILLLTIDVQKLLAVCQGAAEICRLCLPACTHLYRLHVFESLCFTAALSRAIRHSASSGYKYALILLKVGC